MNFSWTDDNVKRLIALVDGTRSGEEIARELGCSRNAVLGKVHRGKGCFGTLASKMVADARRRSNSSYSSTLPRKAPAPSVNVVSIAAKREARANDPGLKAAPMPAVDTVAAPISFRDAIEAGKRCLFYAGDPMSEDGPDMLVCGCAVADAEAKPGDRGRSHCSKHLRRASVGAGGRLDGLARIA